MKKLSLLLILVISTLVSCQEDKHPELDHGVYAEFVTNQGDIVIKLYHEAAPLTVANFISLAEGNNSKVSEEYKDKKFYNGLKFHRVIKDFMIQCGDPLGTGAGNPGYKFPDEFVDSLQHSKKGLLSMANSGPATNGSQFFITLAPTPWLNGRHTIFGEVIKGMDVIEIIGTTETSKPGDKPVKDMILEEVNIINKGNLKVFSFDEAMVKIDEESKKEEEHIAALKSEMMILFADEKTKAEILPSGLQVYFSNKANGQKPTNDDTVLLNYEGYFIDGGLFDSSVLEITDKYGMTDPRRLDANQYGPMPVKYSPEVGMIAGFKEAMLKMSVGDKLTAFIPSHLAYGEKGGGPIKPNSDLIFRMELVEIQK
ncbi:MAG: peptidylprolyl isomerase [Flavobacteriaceae bacterium]|nr:peptidylprolyl isomerase [Flavobacteriaceae bacterium]